MATAKTSRSKKVVKFGNAKNTNKNQSDVVKQKSSKSLTDKEAADKFSGKCWACGK